MSEEIKVMTDEELDEVAAGKKASDKKAKKTNYKCLECQKGTHIGKADNGSYRYHLSGDKKKEGYCKNGHHWNHEMYEGYDPVAAKKWFAKYK